MAKIKYSQLVSGMSGKMGSNVLYRGKSAMFGFSRAYSFPTHTTQNTNIGIASRNIKDLWLHGKQGWKDDLYEYTKKYKNLPPDLQSLKLRTNSPYSVLMKAAFTASKNDPSGLKMWQSDYADILGEYNALYSVKKMIEANLLPSVEGWESLTHDYATGLPETP